VSGAAKIGWFHSWQCEIDNAPPGRGACVAAALNNAASALDRGTDGRRHFPARLNAIFTAIT
jgi:hypothetical protein